MKNYDREHAEIARLIDHVAVSYGAPSLPAEDRRRLTDALELVAVLERAEEHVQDPAIVGDAVIAFVGIIEARGPQRPMPVEQAQAHLAWIYQQVDVFTSAVAAV